MITRISILALILGAAGGVGRAAGPAPPTSVKAGVYTAPQAAAGKTKYAERCASCHHSDLQGDGGCVPSLTGPAFFDQWTNEPLDRYFKIVRNTMPAGNGNTLPPGDYADLVAYLLSENGFPAGSTRLAQNPDSLRTIKIER